MITSLSYLDSNLRWWDVQVQLDVFAVLVGRELLLVLFVGLERLLVLVLFVGLERILVQPTLLLVLKEEDYEENCTTLNL